MPYLPRVVILCLLMVTSLSFISCSNKNDPAIVVCKEFIRKAATGDKTLKDIIDFESAAQKYGISEQELIKKEGEEKWNKMKDDMVQTIIETFAPLKNTYGTAFKKFKVEEKGRDYWIVSFLNPAKERVLMKVRNINGKLKTYYYQK